MNMRLTKDCKHGQLQSICEICAEIEALVQERDSNARLFLEDIKTVEAERDGLRLMEQGLEKTVEQLVHERDAYKVDRDIWQQAALYRAVERDTLKTRLHEVSLDWQTIVQERDALKTDRDEWRDATFSANERFKKAEDALWKMRAERDALKAELEQIKAQEPIGWIFTDDPSIYPLPGTGFHFGKEPPSDAVDCIPLYTRSKS